MSIAMTNSEPRVARTDAVRALEAEFGELATSFRRLIAENAHRVNPGMLPGAYKVFTTIVRHESITTSALAELLLMDKGQLSRTIRELEGLGLVTRNPDPTDGRASLLSPTAEGLERLAAARHPRESALADALELWDVDDIARLTHYLRALSTGTVPPRMSTSE
jgi:DNA-binding MarR family transcriptional regulator